MRRMSIIEICLLLLAGAFIVCGIDFIANPQDMVVFHHSSRFVPSFREFIRKDSSHFYGIICVLLGIGLGLAILYRKRPGRMDNEGILPAENITGDFVDVVHTTNSSDFLTVKLALDEKKIPHNFSGDILIGYGDDKLARFFVPGEFKEKAQQVVEKLQLIEEHGTTLDSATLRK